MADFGLSKEIIDKLEAPIQSFTFEGISERLDQVFNKGWSCHFEGPELISVPKLALLNPRAKNPKAMRMKDTPHWQCSCCIEIPGLYDISREYAVLVPIGEGELSEFEVARDFAFLYTAYYGLGVGRRGKDIFVSANERVELKAYGNDEKVSAAKTTLFECLHKLNLTNMSELDSYVVQWNQDLTSYKDINRTNIEDFVTFLLTKVAEHVSKPN